MNHDTSHRGWQIPKKDTLLTYASALTFIRTLLAVYFAILAAIYGNPSFLLVGLLCYWIGDIFDGILARLCKQEMRSGAIFDIMADRLCVSLIYLIYGWMHPGMLWPIGIYLFEFMFVDGFLSLSFLFWPLLSPNYFFLVDRRIFLLNWSPLGKVANSSFFLLATIFIGNPLVSAAIAVGVIGIKLYSLRRLYKIGIPTHSQNVLK